MPKPGGGGGMPPWKPGGGGAQPCVRNKKEKKKGGLRMWQKTRQAPPAFTAPPNYRSRANSGARPGAAVVTGKEPCNRAILTTKSQEEKYLLGWSKARRRKARRRSAPLLLRRLLLELRRPGPRRPVGMARHLGQAWLHASIFFL